MSQQSYNIHSDTRAVSTVIGFILMFGLLIAGLSIVQTYGVPQQNERVEFNHNLRVQDDMATLADNLEITGHTGETTPTTVEAGTNYPSRLFLFNPSPPIGSLRVGDVTTVTITNASATGDVGDYWNGSTRTFETRPVIYTPKYHVYKSAPRTIIDHGVVYNENPSGQNTIEKQGNFIRGNQISLVTIDGTYSQSRQTMSVESVPLSAPSKSVTITPSEPLQLTIETGLTVEDWETLLEDEPNVRSVTGQDGTVTITLEPTVEYKLRLAKVGLEKGYGPSPGPAYITPVGSEIISTGEKATTEVTFEVRDEFDNGLSGVTVNATTTLGGTNLATKSAQSNADGEVTFVYEAPTVSGDSSVLDRVNATIGPESTLTTTFDPRSPHNVSVSVSVINTDASGIEREISAGSGGSSNWEISDKDETFSQANGKWTNIESIDQVLLSNGEMAVKQECTGEAGSNCDYDDVLSLDFKVTNSTESYTVSLRLQDHDQDAGFDNPSLNGLQDNRDRRALRVYDSAGTLLFERFLTESAAKRIVFMQDNEVDILDASGSTYEFTTGTGGQAELDRLKLTGDVTWFTGEMKGRIDVRIIEQ